MGRGRGEDGFFVYFLSFSSLFYYYSEDLRTHGRKGKKGRWKNEMEVNSKSNCFLFLFFYSFPRSLFGCYLLFPLFFILSSSGLLKCFIFFTLSSNPLFLLSTFHSNDFDYFSWFSLFHFFFIFCSVCFVALPWFFSTIMCNRFSFTHPLPLARFGVVRYIYILKEL